MRRRRHMVTLVCAGLSPLQSARLTNEIIVITASFTTGEPKYKELETSIFTGAGHFVIEDGKTIVEYKVSKVVHR